MNLQIYKKSNHISGSIFFVVIYCLEKSCHLWYNIYRLRKQIIPFKGEL